ncbi:MAG: chorismate mutase [Alphaproteobacteria bacterium]
MSAASDSLEGLRREIDGIDDQIHDLLMRRTAVVVNIARVKESGLGAAYQPAREADLVRRLLARHRGPFPRRALVRLWRELLGATTRLQSDFGVTVYRTEEATGYWDLARDHYGSETPIIAHSSSAQVIAAVAEGTATVGVLPMPQEDDAQAWWPTLVGPDPNMPRVIARLPFVAHDRGASAEALAIARTSAEPTGDDRSLFAIEAAPQMSRARLHEAMTEAGLEISLLLAQDGAESDPMRMHLVDMGGCLDGDDPRLAELRQKGGRAIGRMARIGGYAAPIPLRSVAD